MIRPYWPPLFAGIALGLALLLTFAITGHGLGASGFFTRSAAWLSGEIAPANHVIEFLSRSLSEGRGASAG